MNVPAITPVEKYTADVLPPERAATLWQAMPSHIKPAVFERNLMNALAANPDLMRYDPRLIFREVAKAAGLGLLLDPLLGEGYIVTAYNYRSKQTEPQLRVGYKGMGKLARQSGDVATLYAHEVRALDHVEADQGVPKKFSHKPKLFGDRGDIVGYFAIITFKDGTFDFETMSADECRAIRDRSDAWKAFKDGKIKSTPWSTDEAEMSKKTVLRRLLKRQNQSPEMVAAQRIEDEAEFPHMIESAPIVAASRVPSAPPPAQIEAQAEPAAPPPADDAQPKTPADWIAELRAIKTRPALKAWQDAAKPTLDKLPDADFNQIADAYKAHRETLPKPGPKGEAKPATADPITTGPQPKAAPAPGGQPDIVDEYEDWLKWAAKNIASAADPDVLQTFMDSMVEPNRKHIMPPDYTDLINAFQARDRELSTQ